jgi:hypothetical protein
MSELDRLERNGENEREARKRENPFYPLGM